MTTRPEDSLRRSISRRDLSSPAALFSRCCSALAVITTLLLILVTGTLLDVLITADTMNPAGTTTGSSAVVTRGITAIRDRLPFSSPLPAAGCLLLMAATLLVLRQALGILGDTGARRIAHGVAGRLRRALYRQHLRLGPSDLDGSTASHVRDLFTSAVDDVATSVVEILRRRGRDPVLVIGLFGFALAVDWVLTLQCLLLPAAVGAWLVLRDRAAQRDFRSGLYEYAHDVGHPLLNILSRVRLACGFSLETDERVGFDAELAAGERESARLHHRFAIGRLVRQVLMTAIITSVLFLVIRRITAPVSSLGVPAAAILVAAILGMLRSLDRLRGIHEIYQGAGTSASRIHEYVDRIPPVSQAVGARFLQPLTRELGFESVSWQPEGSPSLLDRLDLEIPAGEVTALVSLDAREARAVAWLLPRFIDPHAGRVLFDGVDIAHATLESLRAETLFVSADGDCFAGTVLENLSCGRPEQGLSGVTDAAKAVHAHHFITRLERGYETPIDARLSQLDAGQCFRLGLARALARDPALLIIEEPDERLDADTKSLLKDTYDRLSQDRTVIFLPGRLSTVRRADRVVLLHQGRVAAMGPHEELVQTHPLYRHWEYIRFNEFRGEALPVYS